jgi:hypothetical protein
MDKIVNEIIEEQIARKEIKRSIICAIFGHSFYVKESRQAKKGFGLMLFCKCKRCGGKYNHIYE